MKPFLRLLRDLFHLAWTGHNPRWFHPDDGYTRWALREHGYYLVACRRCDEAAKRRGSFGGES